MQFELEAQIKIVAPVHLTMKSSASLRDSLKDLKVRREQSSTDISWIIRAFTCPPKNINQRMFSVFSIEDTK